MENKRNAVEKLFNVSFPEDPEWNRWFFDRVYNDEEAMLLTEDGRPVSCLLSQQYNFKFHEQILPMAYLCGVATDRRMRGHGFMSRLIAEMLQQSYKRGDVFAGVIPADRRLFFFYDKFGFATVVYAGIERYSSLHTFPINPELNSVLPLYQSFLSLMKDRKITVMHSERQFNDILDDIRHDSGHVVQIDDNNGVPLAMAFATADNSEIHVKEILGTFPPALDMALGEIKGVLGVDKSMIVYGPPKDHASYALRSRAMMRIVNAHKVLSSLAQQYPDVSQIVRVTDQLIKENNAMFVIKDGECKVSLENERIKTDTPIDVSIDVLTKLIFSDSFIQKVFNIPTARPSMPLMLD